MTKTINMGRLPRPLSASSLQRLELSSSGKITSGQPGLSSYRNGRQVAPRAGAALFASPQQPATVHGCPVSGHLKLDTSSVGEINHRIKLSAQWRDVANIVLELGDRLQPNNIAYALFRLGCLFCFLSSQRRAALEKSGVLERLVAMAAKRVSSFGPAELTFALDGMARLRLKAPTALMTALARQAAENAQELEADQLPLVYWAFATLGYCPSAAVLALLDGHVSRMASQLSAQGVTLVLSAFCTLQHQPSKAVLEALAAAMRPALSTFKREQLASCLDAFKALGFHPGNDLIQGVARIAGVPVPAGALESEAVVTNNVLPGRSGRSLSTQGALQRVREVTMASAEHLLSTSTAREAALVKGLPASQAAGQATEWTCSQGSVKQRPLMPAAGRLQQSLRESRSSTPPQCQSSQDPCTYWRFQGKHDFIKHVQTQQ